jgi:hypothetical protein
MEEIKHLDKIFFHVWQSISFYRTSCHPKFVRMEQETFFTLFIELHKYLHFVA